MFGVVHMSECLSKAEEVYLYIIKHAQSNPNFGKTLFYKMLYFSDFDFYELFEKSITGSQYRKIDNGPAPCDFDRIIHSLKSKKFIQEVHVSSGNIKQIRYLLTREPKFSIMSSDEFAQIKRNIMRLEGMTASQVSAYSHEDMPYKATKMKELIDYNLVHYRNPQFSASAKND